MSGPGVLLRALAWLAPRAALARAHAIDLLKRDYAGARDDRRARAFSARAASANGHIGSSLVRLRARSRELVRDTPHAARALDVLGAHVVGTGIQVQWRTGSDRTDRLLTEAFAEWSAEADVERVLDFAGIQLLAFRAMLEGGDVLVRFVDQPMTGRRRVPFALQVLESDFIDESRDGASVAAEPDNARLGVALGPWSERRGWWVHRTHPAEPLRRLTGSASNPLWGSVFVRYDDAAHLYRPLRPGQVRGVPVLAPILLSARDLADFLDAVVVKARLEACLGLFVERPDTPQLGLTGTARADAEGRKIEEFSPGMVLHGAPGEKVTPILPSGAAQVDPVLRATLRAIAVGAGVTYQSLSGDLSDTNYSSYRAGHIDFRRLVEQMQWTVLAPMLLRRVVDRWLDRAILAGVVRSRTRAYAYDFVMPAAESVDPLKDLKADILAVRSGRLSPQEFVAGYGRPFPEVFAEFQEFWRLVDADPSVGAVFDIDPRKVTQSGMAQPANPNGASDASDDAA